MLSSIVAILLSVLVFGIANLIDQYILKVPNMPFGKWIFHVLIWAIAGLVLSKIY